MISLLAVICSFTTVPAFGATVDIAARYSHEYPAGERYVFQGSSKYYGGKIVAEGVPFYIVGKVNGEVVAECGDNSLIFKDGMETGDLRFWE